ncbi:WPP domain-interacting protein 1 [Camellia lanceoleosa]|uniref:WPP domain-interacting protein 1 n=1 Tax=Camellia lanceoleosa TaxID=1840588 RepID=A0ACC0HF61_9ERIC|nr:WPP domain-interacting protein 1 [Camellia lanceoleosa]
MDLEGECSVLESVEGNEVIISPERLASVDVNKVENNGSWGGENGGDDDKDVGVTESVSSPPLTGKSPVGSVGSSPPAMTKGYGLKKWRRIKREFNKDGSSSADTSKILKRGLSTPAMNSSKPQGSSVETRQKSNGSVSSTNAMLKSMGVGADGFALHGFNLDSRLAVGLDFSAGTDSENSEDRSSKSSTAASVPKSRHEVQSMEGNARDKNRMKTLGVKTLVNSTQKGQQGKGRIETSKKARGERVKIEKENSHSSMESDSRSSNFVFMQGTNNMVTSNGRQSGRSMNYDGENSDEAQGGEQNLGEELLSKENVGEFEDQSQEDLAADLSWEVKEEKVEHHRSSTNRDPLVECIYTLQSAQEELEKEIQKLREIGTEYISVFDGSTQERSLPTEFASDDSNIIKASSADLLDSGDITRSAELETQLVTLKQNINLLENKLEEANTVLKAKEAKVTELEHALNSTELPREEMEAELEALFEQKIEAEVEYLAISRTIQKLRVAAVDEQKTLVSEQAQTLNELGDAKRKAAMLKRRAEKLETSCEDIVETDQVLTLQNRVCKVSSFFFVQLILLVVVFVFLLLQLSPQYAGVVPT